MGIHYELVKLSKQIAIVLFLGTRQLSIFGPLTTQQLGKLIRVKNLCKYLRSGSTKGVRSFALPTNVRFPIFHAKLRLSRRPGLLGFPLLRICT